MYAIRDSILDFISKLHNKGVDIASITAADFGSLLPDDHRREVHELLACVIPEAERQYAGELRQNNRVHQYGTLTAWFKRLLAKGAIDDNFYLALCQNQTYFLDAIRLFIELGLPSSSFDRTKGNREQRLFADTLREMEHRELTLATEEERALIAALQLRLERIKPGRTDFSGTFRDLREGLYFYLKQKQDEDSVDWIVKNFEQIDGDILQSKGQFEQDVRSGRPIRKTYHFACLSDRDMNRGVNDLLPWPLTEDYLREAYSPVDLPYQVYYTALCERGGFLRYALFYGLCFNYCDVRLSYVRQYGDELTEPCAILSLLGLAPAEGFAETLREPLEARVRAESGKLRAFFPFWKDTEIYDLEMRAKNYLLHDIIGKSRGGAVRAYAESHMTMRRLFGKAWFSAELSGAVPVNPYPSFENMAAVRNGRKEYSLHRLPKPENAQAADRSGPGPSAGSHGPARRKLDSAVTRSGPPGPDGVQGCGTGWAGRPPPW